MSTSLSQHDLRQMSEQVDRVVESTGDFSGILSLLRFGREVRGRLVGAVALIILSAVSVLISARILGQLVEVLVSGGVSSRQTVLWIGAWFLGLV